MSVFKLLNRLVRAALLALLAGALWMLWENRERGRPLVDLYVMWEGAGYRRPDPLPRSRGTVARVIEENVVQFRDEQGGVWNVGLSGLAGVGGDGRDPVRRQFALATRTNLTAQLVGKPLEMAWVATNADRTALGFIYWGSRTQSLALDLVGQGRLRWMPEDTRRLPLWEQVRLRAADRKARAEGIGLWEPSLRMVSTP